MNWLGPWKDLLKIYVLVFGAFIIVFPAELVITFFLFDPAMGVFSLCFGMIPFVIGALIIYFVLKKKVTRAPYYGYGMPPPQAYPQYYQYQPPPGQPQYQHPYPYHYQPPPQYAYRPPPEYPAHGAPPPGQPPPPGYEHHLPPPQPPQPQPPPPMPPPIPTAMYAPPIDEGGSMVEKLEIPGVKPLLFILIFSIIIGTVALWLDILLLFIPCFIIAFSFPSLIWVSYVYSKDIYEPEPGRIVLIALTWGMLSTIPSIIFEAPFIWFPVFVLATFVAPPVEEFFKPLILPFLKIKIDGELDGLIYGVTAGMGFAMMENLFYEMSVFLIPSNVDAAAAWSILALARGLGSTIGHAVGAGIIGYAYGMYVNNRGNMLHLAGAFGIAVGLHMTWNGVLTLLEGYETAAIYLFIVVWPILEFFILKYFVDKATEIDRAMFAPGASHALQPKEAKLGAVEMLERTVAKPPEKRNSYQGPPGPSKGPPPQAKKRIRCPKCSVIMDIEVQKRPFELRCPSCDAKLMLR